VKIPADRQFISRTILRISAAALFVLLLVRITLSAGKSAGLIRAIDKRSYTTASEQISLILISCAVALLVCLFMTCVSLWSSFAGEKKSILLLMSFCILTLFYIFGCLNGYALLNNPFVTALFITGKYTMRLLISLLNLAAGIFGLSVNAESEVLWYVTCAFLFLYPFAIAETLLGRVNFWKMFLGMMVFSAAWFLSNLFNIKGIYQILLSLSAAFLAAGDMVYFIKDKEFGSEEKKQKDPLLNIRVDERKRKILVIAAAVLWVITFLTGRVGSFGGLMKLVFGSDLFRYQTNAGSVGSTALARTLLVSYMISVLIRWLFRRISIEDESRFSGFLVASYMLLVQVWILPLLSGFLIRTSEGIQINVSESNVLSAGDVLENSAGNIVTFARTNIAAALVIGSLLIGIVLVLLIAFLFANWKVFRYIVSFLLYFSTCMYVYSIILLLFGRNPNTYVTLLFCYFMNRLISRLLSAGTAVRNRIRSRETEKTEGIQ